MQTCILCGKDRAIFNVFFDYGSTDHTARDDLVEFLGPNVESHLTPNTCVCNICMNVLENVSKLKKRLWSFIKNNTQNNDNKKIRLGRGWMTFANLKFDDEDILCRTPTPSNLMCRTPTPSNCRTPTPSNLSSQRTPTPSNLMMYRYSVPYKPVYESHIAEREKYRSLSRSSYSSRFANSDSSVNNEVAGIFRKRKGRRKGRRAKSASYPKNRTQSKNFRNKSATLLRDDRPPSDSSFVSFYAVTEKPNILRYNEEGVLLNKRTRSVMRAQEDESKRMVHYDSCTFENCDEFFFTIDDLTEHLTTAHNIPALFWCEECKKRYTKMEHLQEHLRIHDRCSLYCFMCSMELENQPLLQNHLNEHMLYSVPCMYCDKSFLSKKSYQAHVKLEHRGKKKRIRYKSKTIVERIDIYSPEKMNKDQSPVTNVEFQIKFVDVSKNAEESSDNEHIGSPDVVVSNTVL